MLIYAVALIDACEMLRFTLALYFLPTTRSPAPVTGPCSGEVRRKMAVRAEELSQTQESCLHQRPSQENQTVVRILKREDLIQEFGYQSVRRTKGRVSESE